MNESREARLWFLLGSAFVIGGGVPLAADIQNWTRAHSLDAEGLKIGVFCSIVVISGLAALATSRIFRSTEAGSQDRFARVWNLMARVATPLGAVTVEYEWGRTLSMPTTYNEKAIVLGGAFIFLAGLIALISERVVAHVRFLADVSPETAIVDRELPPHAHAAHAN